MTFSTDFTALNAMLTGLDGVWLAALDALIKVTLVLAGAGLATLALARASAAIRHLVWTLALVSALLLPVLSIALPRWQLPVVTLAAPPSLDVAPAPAVPPVRHSQQRMAVAPTPAPSQSATPVAPPASSPVSGRVISLTMLLVGIWAVGVAVVIGRLAVGLIAVQWMSRRTARVIDAEWLPLAVALASELGITRRLRFLESAQATMPMACGIVRPSVLMPADAIEWPVERLRIVLLHELAHVKRRDCLTHVVAQLVCAVYWFNPLAWIAARHIRTERERACDDLVLAAGTRNADYAEELLEIARAMRGGRFPAVLAGATLAMARRSQLEGRLIAILDPKVPRSGVSRVRTLLATATVFCALPPLAAMQPWSVAPETVNAQTNAAAIPGATPAPLPDQRTAAPLPTPAPPPTPAPHVRVDDRDMPEAIAQVVTDALAGGLDQAAIQSAQAAIQSSVQGSVRGAIQGAVQGSLHGMANLDVNLGGQEAKASADPRMVAALTAALKDTDKDVRETAMHALIQLKDPSIFEPLVQALKDPSPDVREQAVHGLSQLRDKRAIDPLMGVLKDTNPDVRENVVRALGQLRDPRVVDAIMAALKDENAGVREQAAFALGQLRDARSVDGLIAALKDSVADVRQQSAFALSQIRDKRATVALAGLVKDPDADVRQQAVFALGQMRDASSIDGLMSALHDSKADVRQQAAFALGQIRDPRAVEPLISALKDENADVRQQAAFGLGQIRDRASVEALIIAIKDPDADVRQQVAFALGQIRDPRAIDALTNALKDSRADVRQQAAFALGQLAR